MYFEGKQITYEEAIHNVVECTEALDEYDVIMAAISIATVFDIANLPFILEDIVLYTRQRERRN